jgi:hypothetical protein
VRGQRRLAKRVGIDVSQVMIARNAYFVKYFINVISVRMDEDADTAENKAEGSLHFTGVTTRGVFFGAALPIEGDGRVTNIELCAVVSRFGTAM